MSGLCGGVGDIVDGCRLIIPFPNVNSPHALTFCNAPINAVVLTATLDAFVLSDERLFPRCWVECHLVGVLSDADGERIYRTLIQDS